MSGNPDEPALELPSDAQALLEAVAAISSDLDLHVVLDRIVASACQITSARYGALGVLGSSGKELVDFVTVGIAPDTYAAIGDLPRGQGILGVLIDHPETLRLRRIADHPASYGFPPHHPPMGSFLGAPVRIRGTVFGNLYLTEKQGAPEFTPQDEALLQVFATAAGFVIENARAYAQSERRRLWLEASAEITDALQAPGQVEQALRQVAIGARRLVRGTVVALLQDRDGRYEAVAVDGQHPEVVPKLVTTYADQVAASAGAREVSVLDTGRNGAVVLVPLRSQLADGGVLMVALEDRTALEPEEAELLSSLADQAALALDRAESVADRQELMLVADRDRIARDLHDLVIQRLFATGLQLQGVRRIAVSDEVRERLDAAVADLDTTIRDIRSTIFDLQHGAEASLRAEVRALAKEYVPVLGFTPMVRTTGPVDTSVGRELAEQLLAVLREALSNVARHARASAAVIEVTVDSTRLLLRVTDDGRGLPTERAESGLRNVRRRATEFGGTVRVAREEPGGTVLEWTVPLETPVSSAAADDR